MPISGMAVAVTNAKVIAITGAPNAPQFPLTLSYVPGGALSARTYRIQATFVNAGGESLPSAEYTIAIPANNVVVVSSPLVHGEGQWPGKPTSWNLYATSAGAGSETSQTPTAKVLGVSFQEPTSGLISGTALPTAIPVRPGYTSNANITDVPPATGGIVVPQSPAGVQNTNTGRTLTATQTYLSRMIIS